MFSADKVVLVLFVAFSFSEVYAKKCKCGEENVDSRIVGGTKVAKNKYPWMVYLDITEYDGNSISCGGSLINDRYVLTAAHCLEDAKEVTALFGTNKINSGGKKVGVIEFKTYNYNKKEITNDIALLKLEKPVKFSRKISPICLPTNAMDNFRELTIAGWGYRRPGGSPSEKLLEVTVKHYPFEKCSHEWGGLLPSQFCAGEIGKDSCGGDSGGPAMLKYRGRMNVLGVVSYGDEKCGTEANSVYTKVTSFLRWIQSETRDAEYCD